MQFNNQYNIQNSYNMIQNNPNFNKLIVVSGGDLEINEVNKIKSFILEAISKYDNYVDIAQNIRDCFNKHFEGRWEVVVGERDKFNISGRYNSNQYLVVNIGQYKIAINRID